MVVESLCGDGVEDEAGKQDREAEEAESKAGGFCSTLRA